MRKLSLLVTAVVVCSTLTGCMNSSTDSTTPNATATEKKIVVFSITRNPEKNAQSVNMALTLAGFSMDEGYKVALFFNVKSTGTPTLEFPDDYGYKDHPPLKQQLTALMERGAEVHVCPVCMKDMDIEEEDLMEGAFVTSKPKLFANLGSNTVVFTY